MSVKKADPASRIVIQGETVRVVTPEGHGVEVPLKRLVEELESRRATATGLILPEGVKVHYATRKGLILVHETPPRLYNFKWIAKNSPHPFGRGAKYRSVRVALPYVVVLCQLSRDASGRYGLTGWNEAFFRNQPLESEDDRLFYPALLNCSKMVPQARNPLAWICTQHLDRASVKRDADPSRQVRNCLAALLHHLYETGFNLSSEHHELSSWFTETIQARVDPRLASIESWVKASAKDRMFAITVPWIPTNVTLKQEVDRILAVQKLEVPPVAKESDLSRLILRLAAAQGKGSGPGVPGPEPEEEFDDELDDQLDGDDDDEDFLGILPF